MSERQDKPSFGWSHSFVSLCIMAAILLVWIKMNERMDRIDALCHIQSKEGAP